MNSVNIRVSGFVYHWEHEEKQARLIILSDDEWFIRQNMNLFLTESIFLFMLVEQIQFNEEYKVLKNLSTINSLIKLTCTSETRQKH